MESLKCEIDTRPDAFQRYVSLLKHKKVHVACFASSSPKSCCHRLVIAASGIEPGILVSRVEQANDVGCLHPTASLSIIPQPDAKDVDMELLLSRYMKELILAGHEKYIRLEQLVIMVDSARAIPFQLISKSIYRALALNNTGELKKLDWLQKVIICEC